MDTAADDAIYRDFERGEIRSAWDVLCGRVAAMTTPGIRDLIVLERATEVKLNPTGVLAAVRIRSAHWEENRYCSDVVIVEVPSGRQHRLTRSASCTQMHWLDDDTLAVATSDGSKDDTTQVYVYPGLVGDGWRVTDAEHGVDSFEPFADGIAFQARRPDGSDQQARENRFGTYRQVESEAGRTAVYYVDLTALATYEQAMRKADTNERDRLVRPEVELTELLDKPVAVQSFVASPAGDAVYLNALPTDDLSRFRETSVYRIGLATDAVAEYVRRERDHKTRDQGRGIEQESQERHDARDRSYLGTVDVVHLPPVSTVMAVSPAGDRLVAQFPGRDDRFSTHQELWVGVIDALVGAADAGEARGLLTDITADLDQMCLSATWHDEGIDVVYGDGTRLVIGRLDPSMGRDPQRIDTGPVNCGEFVHTNRAGQIGFVGDNATSYPEAWVITDERATRQLTDHGAQLDGWDLGEVSTIRWTSADGTEIEGTLRLPPHFDPKRRYPLAFVVHGGPRWIDVEQLVPGAAAMYYPEIQLAARDVIILHPNYRGSLGRGAEFQELNVGNLGVGDQWDLESAIDHLDALGWIDTDKVASMGWSQGGYISAFVGTHSERFAAVSVGAGVSDWYTYAISNDVPDFTRDFLRTDLFPEDRSALIASSPMAAIGRASTPTLIQHGGKDQRVPLSNGMELYRGLQERGVPVEMFVFPDFAHPITKPRENHAVLHQNLSWFSHWLLGDDLDLEGPEA